MVNMFDLLDEDLDLAREYEKLFELLYESDIYYGNKFCTLADMFESNMIDWPYRGTSSDLEDVLEKLKLYDTTVEEDAYQELLLLIQFILNIQMFLSERYELNDTLIFKNVEYLLNQLNYESEMIEDRIILIPKNIEVLTALQDTEKDLETYLMEYLDINIQKDLSEKRSILNNISQAMEPNRKEYNKVNKTMTDCLFRLFNKAHIRHNNKSGKNRNNFISSMSDDELLLLYDKIYQVIIYLMNQEKNQKVLKELKIVLEEIEKEKN